MALNFSIVTRKLSNALKTLKEKVFNLDFYIGTTYEIIASILDMQIFKEIIPRIACTLK